MARARRRDEWHRWASWMTLYAECHRDEKKRRAPYTPNDILLMFAPEFAEKRKPTEPAPKMTMRQLAAAMGQPIAESDQPTIVAKR